jgi:hypothetical protein
METSLKISVSNHLLAYKNKIDFVVAILNTAMLINNLTALLWI